MRLKRAWRDLPVELTPEEVSVNSNCVDVFTCSSETLEDEAVVELSDSDSATVTVSSASLELVASDVVEPEAPLVVVSVTVTVVEVTVSSDTEVPSSRDAVTPRADEAAESSGAVVSHMLVVVVVHEDEAP